MSLGTNDDDCSVLLDFAQSSLESVPGRPIEPLAEEMSKEFQSKRRYPSVIARLIGRERLSSPRHASRQQNKSSISYQRNNYSVNIQQKSHQYDDLLNSTSSLNQQQQFKDVYEDLGASKMSNRRSSSRWSASSMLTKHEMAFIQHNIEARRLSSDEKIRDSKAVGDAINHSHDRHDKPSSSHGSHITVLKPSNSVKYEGNSRAWNLDTGTLSNHGITSHLSRKDGLLLEPHNHHKARILSMESKIPLEVKNEEKTHPVRIVVLKPNLHKMHNGTEAISLSKLSSIGFSDPIAKEAREIARRVTRSMRYACNKTRNTNSSGLEGYAGDVSSYEAFGSDSDSWSESLRFSSRRSFGHSKLRRHPTSTVAGSSVNKMAKQRLSERWKMTQRYQDLKLVAKGITLGEMLSLSDAETSLNEFNSKMSLSRADNKFGSNYETGSWSRPLGISSRDGWKVEANITSSRSRSLPPSTGKKSHKTNKYHDKFAEDKYLMRSDPIRGDGNKLVKGDLIRKQEFSYKDLSRSRKPHPRQHIFINDMDSQLDANFEIQMEANVKGASDHQLMFQMAAENDACKTPRVDEIMIAEHGSTTFSLGSEFLPEKSSNVKAVHYHKDSSLQELHKGPPEQVSPLQCLGREPDSSENSKNGDHETPVSVLEVSFPEDASSYECFERVSAELQGVRMQLHLLKMESGLHAEAPISMEDEFVQFSPTVSAGNYTFRANDWETFYVLNVLMYSGLENSGFDMFRNNWHSPNCPLDPELFDNLEEKFNDETAGMWSERKFLFDRINFALIEIFHEHVNLFPWVKPKLAGPSNYTSQKKWIRVALREKMKRDCANREMSGKSLDRDMDWSDYKGEIDMIGNEIEKKLIDDLIEEVLV